MPPISHTRRQSLEEIIFRHTSARKGHVFVDVSIIKKIAIEFAQQPEKPRIKESEIFKLGYRTGYSERSEQEYNEAISQNWQEALEVENEIPTNITITELPDDVNLLNHKPQDHKRHS